MFNKSGISRYVNERLNDRHEDERERNSSSMEGRKDVSNLSKYICLH